MSTVMRVKRFVKYDLLGLRRDAEILISEPPAMAKPYLPKQIVLGNARVQRQHRIRFYQDVKSFMLGFAVFLAMALVCFGAVALARVI